MRPRGRRLPRRQSLRYGIVLAIRSPGVALNVSVALTNPLGATLNGVTTVPVSTTTGRATFPGLSVNRPGPFADSDCRGHPRPETRCERLLHHQPCASRAIGLHATAHNRLLPGPDPALRHRRRSGYIRERRYRRPPTPSVCRSSAAGHYSAEATKQASSGVATFDSRHCDCIGIGQDVDGDRQEFDPGHECRASR